MPLRWRSIWQVEIGLEKQGSLDGRPQSDHGQQLARPAEPDEFRHEAAHPGPVDLGEPRPDEALHLPAHRAVGRCNAADQVQTGRPGHAGQ
jgi:hypothetical protein